MQQRWSARVARAFTPFSADLEMSGGASPYRMSLRYSETEVSGTEFKAGSSHAVATAIQRQVVDQRVDWAAESYTVYATKAEPRVMLREDMPNGLVALLVAVDD